MTADLLYSDVESDLRASVRTLLADRASAADVLARCESDQPYDLALWRMLVELGATSLPVAEDAGGQGASVRETAVVLEELGRAVAPVPFLGSAVLATAALARCPGGADLLRALATGDRIGALAVPLTTAPGGAFPATVTADGTLTGTVGSVADAEAADVLLVPALGADGPELHAVDVGAVTLRPAVPLDLTRRIADVELADAPSTVLATGPDAETAAPARAADRGRTAGLRAARHRRVVP